MINLWQRDRLAGEKTLDDAAHYACVIIRFDRHVAHQYGSGVGAGWPL